MRVTTAIVVVVASAIAATVPLTAAADEYDRGGFTIGANIGSSRINEGDFEGSETGWKAHVGGSFHEIIGGEIGYVDFGERERQVTTTDPFGATTTREEKLRADAWTPALTVGFPVGLAKIYAKGGVAFAEVEGESIEDESKNEDPFYGVGLRIGARTGLGFRAEYERYQFEEYDLDMAQAGLEFNF